MVLDRGLVVLHALNDDCVTRVTSWFPAAKLNTEKVKKEKRKQAQEHINIRNKLSSIHIARILVESCRVLEGKITKSVTDGEGLVCSPVRVSSRTIRRNNPA